MPRGLLSIPAGFLFGLLVAQLFQPGPASAAQLATPSPAMWTTTPSMTVAPAESPTPATPDHTATPGVTAPAPEPTLPGAQVLDPIEVTSGITLGWTGEVECWNCSPFAARVRLSHYSPWQGGPNCWLWSEEFNFCMSDMRWGAPWPAFVGLAAACDEGWLQGTWVNVPELGLAVICMDTGGAVKCHPQEGYCNVDILGPGGAAWDGQLYDAVLWVPLKPRR